MMKPATIYLSLGTNLGDRLENLHHALDALFPEVQVQDKSSIYETEPWGFSEQSPFLNMVVRAQTRLSPPELLSTLNNIEARLGRQPNFRYGPRLIDLDILLYGNLVVDTPRLTIPHPHLAQRAFVLVPLAEIAPGFIHPSLGQTIHQLKSQINCNGVHKLTRESVGKTYKDTSPK